MSWLRDRWRNWRGRLFHRNRNRVVRIPPPPVNGPNNFGAHPPFPPGVNPMLEALRRIFAARDRAEERRAFRAVGPDGTVVEVVEERFREGDENIIRIHRTKVRTCSGQIVIADNLQGFCICGGADDQISRCHFCGLPLCRLHARVFRSGSGEMICCDRHYRQAIGAVDNWKLLDAQKRSGRQS